MMAFSQVAYSDTYTIIHRANYYLQSMDPIARFDNCAAFHGDGMKCNLSGTESSAVMVIANKNKYAIFKIFGDNQYRHDTLLLGEYALARAWWPGATKADIYRMMSILAEKARISGESVMKFRNQLSGIEYSASSASFYVQKQNP